MLEMGVNMGAQRIPAAANQHSIYSDYHFDTLWTVCHKLSLFILFFFNPHNFFHTAFYDLLNKFKKVPKSGRTLKKKNEKRKIIKIWPRYWNNSKLYYSLHHLVQKTSKKSHLGKRTRRLDYDIIKISVRYWNDRNYMRSTNAPCTFASHLRANQ